MRICLVAMPWSAFDVPSAALGVLAGVIRRRSPQHDLQCKYAYVDVAEAMGCDLYSSIAEHHTAGELIYAAHLYPERKESTKEWFVECADKQNWIDDGRSREDQFEHLYVTSGRHAESCARELAGRDLDVVGFTTTCCQLFPSLVLARRLAELDAKVKIVLGGMGVPYDVGPSVLREYPFVDFVVQGEGEERFLRLLQDIESGDSNADRQEGVLSQSIVLRTDEATSDTYRAMLANETKDLNALPLPDYDDYYEVAEEHNLLWRIPLEGSRGCWWDRVKRTGNPMDACYFCGLNTSSYREKSIERIAEEMKDLSEKYSNVRLQFLDNVIRHRGVEALADSIRGLGKSFSFFYEIRAQIHPYEIMRLWEAGCDTLQIGIEGLSSTYLKRIGKGTSTIQNLQAMKTCYELGIMSMSNLLTYFPGATAVEVEETTRNILRYAIAYQPAELSRFRICMNNAVHRMPEKFQVTNIRNSEAFKAALPEKVWKRMSLFWLDFDYHGEKPDWTSVENACKEWKELHRKLTLEIGTEWFLGAKPLFYNDGVSFLEILDRRHDYRIITLDSDWRELYVFCMEIRTRSEIDEHFDDRSTSENDEKLAAFVEQELMFKEGERYLSLAVASRPPVAVRRIRAAWKEARRKPIRESFAG